MSNYEGMHGRGVAKQADLRALRTELQEIYNKVYDAVPASGRKGYEKANTRTRTFHIAYHDGQEGISGGWGFHGQPAQAATQLDSEGLIQIDPDEGTFSFRISENNHSVERANQSPVFQRLMKFIAAIPVKGEKYGAQTYHWSEYDEDGYGNEGPGATRVYGGWKNHKHRHAYA